MATHRLKFIALAAVFSLAPALASAASVGKHAQRHCCPKKHAQAAAGGAGQAQAKGATTITLPDRIPDGSLLDLGFRRGIFTP